MVESLPDAAALRSRPAQRRQAWAIALAAALLNVIGWRLAQPPVSAPDAPPRLSGLAYSPFQRWDDPLAGRYPPVAAQDADLALIASLSGRVRTYSSADFAALPALAARHGLKVTLGVWLDRRADNNAREIDAGIAAARAHAAVERVVVGNETQLNASMAPQALIAALRQVRAAVRVPVSTAEPWHVWLERPDLAHAVDFLTVHLLPYWEGAPMHAAADLAFERLRQLRARYPGKHIVVGEIGWPSGGVTLTAAQATPALQARFVREFAARAAREHLDYFVIEAFDQPWKVALEGPAGAHWGLFDAARAPKFALAGPLDADAYWRAKAGIAALLGLLVSAPLLLRLTRLRARARVALALGAQAAASGAVLLAAAPLIHYLRGADTLALALFAAPLALAMALVIAQWLEFVELYWPGSLTRVAAPRPLAPGAPAPLVSLHLACCNEPPEMVIAAIDSLVALAWPDLEVVVVDNNTADAALWRPVEAHVAALARAGQGPRVRFFHLPTWPGFKAGALNFALAQTDARAAWIGVVDADYVVRRDWLRELGGWCADARVAIVQAPQAHRRWEGTLLGRVMHSEYEGFFRIGMHHRHERDAIVHHGTMTLIRAAALKDAGGWDEACVCEDTELGLRLIARGQRAVYVDRNYGAGLVPDDLAAWLRQRRRWAEGGMQILRKHCARLAGASSLSLGQRYHFLAGWLPWVGDALHLPLTFAALAWTLLALALPSTFGLPVASFAAPLAALLVTRGLMGPLLYARRVDARPAAVAGAALAGLALSHTVARGVIAGLAGRRAEFGVTRKGRAASSAGALARFMPVREEAALAAALAAAAAALAWVRAPLDAPAQGWLLLLAAQSLPYAAALALAALPAGGERAARGARPVLAAKAAISDA